MVALLKMWFHWVFIVIMLLRNLFGTVTLIWAVFPWMWGNNLHTCQRLIATEQILNTVIIVHFDIIPGHAILEMKTLWRAHYAFMFVEISCITKLSRLLIAISWCHEGHFTWNLNFDKRLMSYFCHLIKVLLTRKWHYKMLQCCGTGKQNEHQ